MRTIATCCRVMAGASAMFLAAAFTYGADGPFRLDTSVQSQATPAPATQPVYLQLVNPADNAHDRSTSAATQPVDQSHPLQSQPRLRSYEMPAVHVIGQAPSELREEETVGSYEQPRWTAERRFPGTRIYVQPEGTVEFEFWLRPTIMRHGGTQMRSLAELEFGLPGRFQLDLYLRTESMSGTSTQVGESVEIRYAFADWNKIWGNPTIYVEWSRLENESDSIEVKLLLGGEIAPRWHWGANISDELLTGEARDNEIEVTGGVSYTLFDSFFSVGAETECGIVDHHNHRGTYDDNFFYVGPSFQYRPTEQIHIDFAPLVGIGHENPAAQIYFVFGYEF